MDNIKNYEYQTLDLDNTDRGYIFNYEESDTKCFKSSNHVRVNKNADYSYEFNMYMTDDDPQIPYEPNTVRPSYISSTLHIGQRKLLLQEEFFLTKYCNNDNSEIVVYAGAGRPGEHNKTIIDMFPNIYKFIYIDPQIQYEQMYKDIKNVDFYVELMTDELSKKFKKEADSLNKKIVFISDIRRVDESDEFPSESAIISDMDDQVRWMKIMKAKISMLKFRLPYDSDAISKYPDGEIIYQAFPGKHSTETRLICKYTAKNKSYNNREYENRCYWHNTQRRRSCFNTPDNLNIEYINGLDHCYDCTYEIYVHNEYYKRFFPDLDIPTRSKLVNNTINYISFKTLNNKQQLYYIPGVERKLEKREFLKKKYKKIEY
jgi:hypothetical protein